MNQALELRLYLALTRRLPRVKGAGYFANRIRALYNRKPRPAVRSNVLGFDMELEPAVTAWLGRLLLRPVGRLPCITI